MLRVGGDAGDLVKVKFLMKLDSARTYSPNTQSFRNSINIYFRMVLFRFNIKLLTGIGFQPDAADARFRKSRTKKG